METIEKVTGKCSVCDKRTQGKTNGFLCRKCKQLLDTQKRIKHLKSLSPFDIGWLTGMIEGEGCFYQKGSNCKLKSGNYYCYPLVGFTVMSTDEDVMIRLSNLLQFCIKGPYYTRSKKERKKVWSVQVTGYKAIIIMNYFYEYLGVRRKSQIDLASEWQKIGRFQTTCRTARIKSLRDNITVL